MRASVAERRAVLEEAVPRWQPRTLSQALDAATERHPDRPLILTDERELTYREVRDWSRRLAAGLIASGVRADDHVALVLANYPELIALKFAIARAGAVAVPINFLLRAQELAYVLRQSDASMLVTMARFRDLDYLGMLDGLHPGWRDGGGGDPLPMLREVIVFAAGSEPCGRAAILEDLERRAGAEHWNELRRREEAAQAEATADLIYTSGTSGMPKGVILTHDQLLRSAYGSAWTRAFEDGRRILFALPLYHVFAYVEGLLATMFVGGAVIPQVVFDPLMTLRGVQCHGADEALFVPTMSVAVLESARTAHLKLNSLQAVMSAAAPAPVRLWRAVREELGVSEVTTGYGMTETSAATTLTQPDGPLELVSTTVGEPKFGAAAGDPALDGLLAVYKTIDPLSGEELPAHSEGELVVRGPIVTRGYYRKDEETAAAIDSEGWLRSGDLGKVDSGHGHLLLTGRSKELYKCGGELVAPKEVEEVLTDHPGVEQAYVVGVPQERMGEVGCAWVVPAGEDPPSPRELIEFCRGRLARFKVPDQVIYVPAEELPTTATGKVQKFRLVERALAGSQPPVEIR